MDYSLSFIMQLSQPLGVVRDARFVALSDDASL
jgi:hypothetical protein